MEIEPTKQKILAGTTALMTLKVDNEDLVKHTFKSIRDQVEALLTHAPGKEEYTKAFEIVQAGMHDEYEQFHESVSYDQKEQALIQLRHKAAEVCALLRPD